MRLGLFGFVLFGLLASSLAARRAMHGIASQAMYGIATRIRDPNREPPPPPQRIPYERNGNNNPGSCSRVTKRQIQNLNTVLNEAINTMTRPDLKMEIKQALDSEKLPSSSRSSSRQPRANMPNNMNTVSSQNDHCQQLILEMKGATEEILKLVELVHERMEADDPRQYDAVETGRLKIALETKMSQLDSASINLETGLKRNQNRDMRAARREMEENVLCVEIVVDVFKSRAEKQKAGIQNYELLILQIREGNLTGANLCYEKLEGGFWEGDDEFEDDENDDDDEDDDEKYFGPFLKWIVQDAYDGQTLTFLRNTLAFAFQLDLSRDEETYPTLFEKVKVSSAHRSDPRVLLLLSFCIAHSIEMHKQENVSAPAVLKDTDWELFFLIRKEILQPWARDIRQGNISSIRQFERQASESESELELEGFRIFLNLLVQKAYDGAHFYFERTLDFVKGLESPRLRAMGLRQLFDDLKYKRDHGTLLAFQVKKLLDSVPLKAETETEAETEDEYEDEPFVRREMPKLKADLPQWERLAVWGGGTCHIQNNYYDEYLDAFSDIPLEVTDENKKRRIFTRARKDKEVKAEWTFHASQEDQGHTFKIQALDHKGEWLFADGLGGNNDKDNDNGNVVFLGRAKGPWSHFQTSKWIVERVKRGTSWFFTIKNQGNGQYLSAGNIKPGQDFNSNPNSNRRRRPVITISEHSSASDKHLWRLRCDRV